jgi:hypothetical protein
VLSWVVSGAAVLLALVALALVRRLARRFDSLTQSYWELRYEYTRRRSRLSRLDPEDGLPGATADDRDEEPRAEALSPASPSVSFIPLSTIRKKDK